jgi:hypothetical protein
MTYDDLTDPVMGDYRSFLSALTGMYLSVTTPGSFVTPHTVALVSSDAHRFAQTFIARAESEMMRYAAAQGVESAWLAPALAGVHVAVAQNIKTALKSVRGAELSPAAMLKNASGGIGLLVQQKLGKLDFRVTDARGRMFGAETLMRTTIRQFAVQTAFDAVAARAHAAGVDEVTVQHPDRPDERMSFADARRLFHPNTKAVPHV